MSQQTKLLKKILLGRSDRNIDFNDLCGLLKHLGFSERIKGSHHIFSRENVMEILNIQPIGSMAKTYQVKQIRKVLIQYSLGEIENE